MSEPEFLICLNCDSPNYTFEWLNDKVVTIICTTCGNEDPLDFLSETEYEELSSS